MEMSRNKISIGQKNKKSRVKSKFYRIKLPHQFTFTAENLLLIMLTFS